MTSGKELKKWRIESAGLTGKQLADKLISPRTGKPPHFTALSQWELDKKPIPSWALEQIERLDRSMGPDEFLNVEKKVSKSTQAEDISTKRTFQKVDGATLTGMTIQGPGPAGASNIILHCSPELKSLLAALIKAIVVDPEDIKDPVIRGMLKQAEGR